MQKRRSLPSWLTSVVLVLLLAGLVFLVGRNWSYWSQAVVKAPVAIPLPSASVAPVAAPAPATPEIQKVRVEVVYVDRPVEKIIYVDRPVEKVTYVEKEVPVEKVVYVDRQVTVEKVVVVEKEVPVERLVYKDRPITKIVYVDREVQVPVYVDRPVLMVQPQHPQPPPGGDIEGREYYRPRR